MKSTYKNDYCPLDKRADTKEKFYSIDCGKGGKFKASGESTWKRRRYGYAVTQSNGVVSSPVAIVDQTSNMVAFNLSACQK